MKLTLTWIEHHNPDNWADDKNHGYSKKEKEKIIEQYDLKEYPKEYQLGVLNILASLPNPVLEGVEDDLWIEVTAHEEFEVNNIEEAKAYAENRQLELLPECEIFSVTDENNKVLFTEEDL